MNARENSFHAILIELTAKIIPKKPRVSQQPEKPHISKIVSEKVWKNNFVFICILLLSRDKIQIILFHWITCFWSQKSFSTQKLFHIVRGATIVLFYACRFVETKKPWFNFVKKHFNSYHYNLFIQFNEIEKKSCM